MIYFGGSEGNANRWLWAYDFNLDYVWHFPTSGHVPGSPAIGSDGTIYVGSYDNNLYAIDPDDGTEKWHYTTGGKIFSSPAVGADGVIYFGSFDNKIYAVNHNGSPLWSYPTGGSIYSSPAIAPNMLYVGSMDGYLYAIGGFCRINPPYLDFGTVLLEDYVERTFTITNDPSNEDPLYLDVSVSSDHFRIVSGGGPYTLNPGDSRDVTVCFEPRGVVRGTCSCTIETGDDICCDVYCTGFVPAQIAPGSIGFGTVDVGSYKDMSFCITNNKASGTLTGLVSESSDVIEIVSGNGVYFLGPGESVRVTVRFRPSRNGPFECMVDTGNSRLRDVRCYGRGKEFRDDKRDIFLDQNKPNPFNPVTEIGYSLPVSCRVRLVVYNILGQKVATLVDEYQSACSKVVRWDGRDDNGLNVVSGVYFYRLQAGRSTDMKKMVLLR